MARCGLLLAATAVILAVAAPNAMAGQFASEGFGLAGTPGTGNLPGHANAFLRDGLASQCNDGMGIGGSPTMTPGPFGYKSRPFTSVLNEPVCVTMAVTAPTCMGTDGEVMSETYSPAYNPARHHRQLDRGSRQLPAGLLLGRRPGGCKLRDGGRRGQHRCQLRRGERHLELGPPVGRCAAVRLGPRGCRPNPHEQFRRLVGRPGRRPSVEAVRRRRRELRRYPWRHRPELCAERRRRRPHDSRGRERDGGRPDQHGERTRYGDAGLHPGRGPRGSVARRGRPRSVRAPGRHGPPKQLRGAEVRAGDVRQ